MQAKVAVITGAHGFIGSHLSDYLLSQGYIVYGITRPGTNIELYRLSKARKNSNFRLVQTDTNKPEQISAPPCP